MKAPFLLCEDNRADVLLVKQAIRRYRVPVELHVVSNGDQAIAFLDAAENSPDAPAPAGILLDLNLPQVSGMEVLEHIRSSGKWKDIPVVIFTSSDSAEDRRKAAALGATRYFHKPSNYEEFLQIGSVLNEVLGVQ